MKTLSYERNNNGDVVLTISMSIDEFNDHFVRCEACGEIIHSDDALMYEGEFFCDSCTTICHTCGQIIPNYYSHTVADSSVHYCNSCWGQVTYTCNDCGDHFRYEDSLTEGSDGEYYCSNCIDDHDGCCLDDYHTMKCEGAYEFYGDESRESSPYMGVEIEVDSDHFISLSPILEWLNEKWGDFLHQEHDGSLEYGFENITMPASLSYHLSVMDDYADTFGYLLDCGLRGHDIGTAGIHVHIDRTYFGSHQDSAIAKLLFIFEKYRDELQKFARRTTCQLDRWAKSRKKYSDSSPWIKKTVREAREYPSYQDRYYSVNLCNSDTIEIRIFRSTLNIETYEAILRFVARLAFVAKNIRAVELASMSFEELMGDDEHILAYWKRISGGVE